jgi:hypothetical protein
MAVGRLRGAFMFQLLFGARVADSLALRAYCRISHGVVRERDLLDRQAMAGNIACSIPLLLLPFLRW